ncbi:hypothetical protein Bca4012_020360 [Brassica carinata]
MLDPSCLKEQQKFDQLKSDLLRIISKIPKVLLISGRREHMMYEELYGGVNGERISSTVPLPHPTRVGICNILT